MSVATVSSDAETRNVYGLSAVLASFIGISKCVIAALIRHVLCVVNPTVLPATPQAAVSRPASQSNAEAVSPERAPAQDQIAVQASAVLAYPRGLWILTRHVTFVHALCAKFDSVCASSKLRLHRVLGQRPSHMRPWPAIRSAWGCWRAT